MVRAATTSSTAMARAMETTPSSSTQMRLARTSCSGFSFELTLICLPNQPATNGVTSVRATVAAAISAPEAVDIIAATAAARTRPPTATGRSWVATSA